MLGAIVAQIGIFHRGQKGAEKISLMLNENHLDIPSVSTTETVSKLIKVLCEQTRELTDDLHDFLDYV